MATIASSNTLDISFTPQWPCTPVPRAPTSSISMQTKVQAIMNAIRALAPSQGDNWNYVDYRPFSKAYHKAPISDKFNTLWFDRHSCTTDPDKHLQYFLALMMIFNTSDMELCHLFPNSLRDFSLLVSFLGPELYIGLSGARLEIQAPVHCSTWKLYPPRTTF